MIGHKVHLSRQDVTPPKMMLKVAKEGMKSFENNHDVSTGMRTCALCSGTSSSVGQRGDLYITFDVEFPSTRFPADAAEGEILLVCRRD